MSMYYRCYGYLSFENEAEAKVNYGILTGREDTRFCFFPNELELEAKTIKFNTTGNFSSYSTCEKTDDLIHEIAANALRGYVNIDEGDSEDSPWSWKSYSVFNKQVHREHTDPQRSYKFKGELEFANEVAAKSACQSLLTDPANSIFTKFPPNQKIFADDKRVVHFDGNTLVIDAHCPGNEKIFKKTVKLFNKLKTESIGGEIEIAETYDLRFVPDNSENSSDWVNNMERKIFYRYSGSLTFLTAEEANDAYERLLSGERSLFTLNAKMSFPLYVFNEMRLIFDDIGECSRKLFNETHDIVEELAATAKTGKVEGAFSNTEMMDSYVVDRMIPSKVKKWKKWSKIN